MTRRLLRKEWFAVLLFVTASTKAGGDPAAAVAGAFSQGNAQLLAPVLPDRGKVFLSASSDLPLPTGYFASGQTLSQLHNLFSSLSCQGFVARGGAAGIIRGTWQFAKPGSGARLSADVTVALAGAGDSQYIREIRIQTANGR